MSAIMAATGLKKGGIYNHFESKEALALAAFEYALAQVRTRFVEGLRGKRTTPDRLRAIVDIMARYVNDPPVPGGCPILNTAVDSDDTHPFLQARARAGMEELQRYIHDTVIKGMARNELRPNLDADQIASVFVAMLEGALVLSNLYDNPQHMDFAVAHLRSYIENQLVSV